jgi:dienelactone hydrolase
VVALVVHRGGSSPATPSTAPATTRPAVHHAAPPSAIGITTFRISDPHRTIRMPDGTTAPRSLVVTVRYPATGPTRGGDVPNAPPAAGRHPLIVFGHGFDITPAPYAPLLRAWVRAGYVVAAPTFPRAGPDAPGGPDEADLVHQPSDVSLVITRLEAGIGLPVVVRGIVDPARIAVAGHSDGGDTALAVAYDARFRDRRVDAAIILAGAEIPFLSSFRFPPAGPPLLAVQGTADVINLPSATQLFFAAAAPPKYLLTLFGMGHLPPYSTAQPALGVVERTTIAFLNRYLGTGPSAGIVRAGTVAGVGGVRAVP